MGKPSAKTESLIDQPIYCLLSSFYLEVLSIVSFIWKESDHSSRTILEGLLGPTCKNAASENNFSFAL